LLGGEGFLSVTSKGEDFFATMANFTWP